MDKKVYLSAEGYKKLQERLETLTNVERPNAVEKLATAREHGDLSENAEYTTAKEALAKITAEIEELEEQLKVAVIYSAEEGAKGKVSLGSKVKVYDAAFDEEVTYTIVGTAEADIMENKISNDSVVGKALIGKKKGEVVTIPVEKPYELKIIEIIK
ncbi:MAG: transcription elongation factor GreA [Clostridia bacterium]|nr:transcription elongation factor GreA [Clostridia bacterium]MBP5373198.1 transcription elongation factor GreA [Clostridia bacterium]